jgi:hypothetical protein
MPLHLLLRALLALAFLSVLPACGTTPRASPPTPRATGQAGGEVFEIAAGKPFRWRGRAGTTLELENVNGSIEATTTSEPDVEIVAEMRDDDERTAGVVLTQTPSGVSFCVRSERVSTPSCEGHTRASHGRGAAVHVTVHVPAGLHLVARTVNGRVHVRGVIGRVEASAVNGQVLLEDVRDVRASSVNGKVQASFADGPLRGPVELFTVNGGVSVELPAGTDADLRADTVRGHVAIELPGATSDHGGRVSHVRLALGHGGHELSLRTVHGSIRVEERR